MDLYLFFGGSIILNILLIWYLLRLLRKFYFISENIADLYFTMRAFRIFVHSLWSMDSYYGEPMIHELIHRIKDMSDEIEIFRDVFQYALDQELEEELNDIEKAAQEEARK
tara:strand:- start:938 stop:1270 length:333 start_codon:yes stop_codon:yes gene_type:complete